MLTLNFENIFTTLWHYVGDWYVLIMGLVFFMALLILVYEWFRFKP
jgi:hypothetical protein